MRSDAPALLPILRSRHLAEVLTLILLHPDTEYSLTELAGTLGQPLTTVQREVTRLSSAQLIRERRIGRSRLVSADTAGRYTKALTELLTIAFGPRVVIAEEFGALDAIAVAIYGSWAARYEGIEGHPPHDVDVLVIGGVPRSELYEAAERAEQRLGLPVNPTLCSRERWFAAADALIQQIRTAPLLWVVGESPHEGAGLCAGASARLLSSGLLAVGHIESPRRAGGRRVLAETSTARPRSFQGPRGAGSR